MDKSEIMKEIDERVMSEKHKDYKLWTIGITNNPERRKSEHENDGKKTGWWKHWQANSEKDARDIEEFFIEKRGMKGGGGGPGDPTYVYIF